ncbi:saccharopine dehydrogenase NADP-binding domain-containing protein [Candidatus Pacearchaeota archaeon]|nr:saccharopine dehydrogenase NADP-binding domain-containing protein [Candidatus Pacearchaeota archaeon]
MACDFIIFGGTGQQGRICARDLLECGYKIVLAGRDSSAVQDVLKSKNADFMKVDLKKQEDILAAIFRSGAKVVVNCAELIYNVPIMKACIVAGRSCTDLGGLHDITIQQFKLDSEFRRKGIINITGCGSTPGITNVMAAHAINDFDRVDTIDLGFAWDSNMKDFVVPYSIKSIFNEFTTPPIILKNGKLIKTDRRNCVATYMFKDIGRQTVHCIVHSEAFTFAKYFKYKGIKNLHYMAGFPEHSLKVINMLMDLGFDSEEELEVNGVKINPASFTTQVLKRLGSPPGYTEVENLWVRMRGVKNKKPLFRQMDCVVKTLKGWEKAGSNVNTGRTISIISQMVFNRLITQAGVYGPEAVVPCPVFFQELERRGIHIYDNGRRINEKKHLLVNHSSILVDNHLPFS